MYRGILWFVFLYVHKRRFLIKSQYIFLTDAWFKIWPRNTVKYLSFSVFLFIYFWIRSSKSSRTEPGRKLQLCSVKSKIREKEFSFFWNYENSNSRENTCVLYIVWYQIWLLCNIPIIWSNNRWKYDVDKTNNFTVI